MNRIIEELRIRGKEEIAYVKSLHLGPSFNKLNETSSEDVLTQVAAVEKKDTVALEKDLEYVVTLQYLTDKYYKELYAIVHSSDVPLNQRRKIFNKPPKYFILERTAVLLTMSLLIAILVMLCLFVIPKLLVLAIWIMYGVMTIGKSRPTRAFHRALVTMYFKLMGYGR